MTPISAITLDLDDTLWENTTVIARAEEAVQDVLEKIHPCVAQRFSVDDLRAWRERVTRECADIGHDYSDVRRHTYREMFVACNLPPEHSEHLIKVFMDARHELKLFDDVLPVLAKLSATMPIVSLSNGNADIERIGIRKFFYDRISPRDVGAAKPDARMFDCAQLRLGVPRREILHVGDHPLEDISGARDAGFQTAWVNRAQASWPHSFRPDYVLRSMHELHCIPAIAAYMHVDSAPA